MQPYLFPYIGYFQYVAYVDKLIVYDDVAFIKQGWINRNQVLLNGKASFFTVPLQNASSFRTIRDIAIHEQSYLRWKEKFYKTLEQAYKKAPYYETVFPLLAEVFESESKSMCRLALYSIKMVCGYLSINTLITESSAGYNNAHLSGQERIMDICKQEQAASYINLKGGMDLYDKERFRENNIILQFIGSKPVSYRQYDPLFIPSLSLIDVLMFNDKEQVWSMLNQYEIL